MELHCPFPCLKKHYYPCVPEPSNNPNKPQPPQDPNADPAAPASAQSAPQPKELSPEEQMALYEKELKENDWGHQPC
jgi:hypothetical protein